MRYYEKIDGSKYRNIFGSWRSARMLHEPDEKLETIGFDTKKTCLSQWAIWLIAVQRTSNARELITFPGSELYVETMSK